MAMFEQVVEFFEKQALFQGINPNHKSNPTVEPYYKYGFGCYGSIRLSTSRKQTKISVMGESSPDSKNGGGTHYSGKGSTINDALHDLLSDYLKIFNQPPKFTKDLPHCPSYLIISPAHLCSHVGDVYDMMDDLW